MCFSLLHARARSIDTALHRLVFRACASLLRTRVRAEARARAQAIDTELLKERAPNTLAKSVKRGAKKRVKKKRVEPESDSEVRVWGGLRVKLTCGI